MKNLILFCIAGISFLQILQASQDLQPRHRAYSEPVPLQVEHEISSRKISQSVDLDDRRKYRIENICGKEILLRHRPCRKVPFSLALFSDKSVIKIYSLYDKTMLSAPNENFPKGRRRYNRNKIEWFKNISFVEVIKATLKQQINDRGRKKIILQEIAQYLKQNNYSKSNKRSDLFM